MKIRHPLYRTWVCIKDRCYNKNRHDYKYYGGRGIKVYDEWLNDFWAFVEDMGAKPSPNHSIDRVDNNGHYEPKNCRWSTMAEQHKNKRPNVSQIKLSEEVKNTIRERLNNGERNGLLAKEFQVSTSLISRIKTKGLTAE